MRDTEDIYVNLSFNNYNITKYSIPGQVLGKTIYDVCTKHVANYYKICGLKAIDTDKEFISKKIYSTLGKEYSGLLYFIPNKDQNGKIIGTTSYNVDLTYIKSIARRLFKNNSNLNNQDISVKKIYYNLISYKEPFEQILKIIDNIDPKNILNSNNIKLIANLKFNLSILLNNLNNIHKLLTI